MEVRSEQIQNTESGDLRTKLAAAQVSDLFQNEEMIFLLETGRNLCEELMAEKCPGTQEKHQ
jgi:hypothetical protein